MLIQPLNLDKQQRNRRLRIKRYSGIGLQVISYIMLATIVIANANLQTLLYFLDKSESAEEQKLEAV
jgi:hypothetical protein